MRAERRRLPLQVKPLEGESIESWLEATALAVGLTMGAVAAVGGLPTTARPSWRTWLLPTQTVALAAATGLPRRSLEAMTLSRYDGLALRLDPESHRPDPDFPFGPLSWSRFCPACLRETAGRWRLNWRLGWSFRAEFFVDCGAMHQPEFVAEGVLAHQLGVVACQRRAPISRDEARRPQTGSPIGTKLIEGRAHRGLHTAEQQLPLHEGIAIL